MENVIGRLLIGGAQLIGFFAGFVPAENITFYHSCEWLSIA